MVPCMEQSHHLRRYRRNISSNHWLGHYAAVNRDSYLPIFLKYLHHFKRRLFVELAGQIQLNPL